MWCCTTNTGNRVPPTPVQAELEGLLVSHLSLIKRVVRQLLGNEADVLDAVPHTALRATACVGQFRGESSFQTWLVTIALNEARQLLRRRQRCRFVAYSDALIRNAYDASASPERIACQTDEAIRVRQAVSQLPPFYRAVIVLCDFEEQTIEQAAQLLDITETAVRTRRLRARHLLKMQLIRNRSNRKTGLTTLQL